ncbi:hypothetical protein PPEP_b1177 [Pseudoalteromonas peptidolytica F12-50-A1]|uniref:Uncharacterized protein n=1 Tax=Pseudoalteromonas peptidolytica F12-50-A1 TaxID=1315280 RepID=A0A8I0MZX0_9GAMM|nr:hypothetical protein [Pseudoalteromonas peptidolytica F12-50-A1]GEK10768.1 hypothetical protein PPE03_30170 [Pseudoalteromonas peptidolytica]
MLVAQSEHLPCVEMGDLLNLNSELIGKLIKLIPKFKRRNITLVKSYDGLKF